MRDVRQCDDYLETRLHRHCKYVETSVRPYVQTCMRAYPSERDQTLTNVTDETRGCIATV